MIGLIFLIPLLSVPCGFLMQMRYPSAAGPKEKKKMEKEEEKLEMLLCFAYVKVCQVGNKQQGDMCTGAEAKSKVAACSNAVSARRCGRLRCRRWWWWCSHWWLRPTRKVIGPASRKAEAAGSEKKESGKKTKTRDWKGGVKTRVRSAVATSGDCDELRRRASIAQHTRGALLGFSSSFFFFCRFIHLFFFLSLFWFLGSAWLDHFQLCRFFFDASNSSHSLRSMPTP